MTTTRGAPTPITADELHAAAYRKRYPGTGCSVAQEASRWRRLAPKLSRAERERYLRDAFRTLHEPELMNVVGTMVTPDGRTIPCEYAVIDEAYDRRYREGRIRGEIAHAAFLVHRAQRAVGQARAATRGRRREHRSRPGHRRTAASRAGPGDDSGPADPEPERVRPDTSDRVDTKRASGTRAKSDTSDTSDTSDAVRDACAREERRTRPAITGRGS